MLYIIYSKEKPFGWLDGNWLLYLLILTLSYIKMLPLYNKFKIISIKILQIIENTNDSLKIKILKINYLLKRPPLYLYIFSWDAKSNL